MNDVDSKNFLTIRDEQDWRLQTNLLDPDAQQGYLSIGLPELGFAGPTRFLNCVFWFPFGLPIGSSIHLTSSRLGKQLGSKSPLFDAIRTFALHFKCDSHFLTTHAGTTLNDYVNRLEGLFGIPVTRFQPLPKNLNSKHFVEVLNSDQPKNVCYYGLLKGQLPQVDELLIQSASEVRVLSAQRNGNVARQSLIRLRHANLETVRTRLLIDCRLTSKQVTEKMRESGVTDWWLYDSPTSESSNSQHNVDSIENGGPIFSLDDFKQKNEIDEFMIHWTRRRTGPWPDQCLNQFIDELILGVTTDQHSRIAALCRIVTMKMLIADGKLNRSNTPVVSFSDCRVDSLINKRIFRAHLSGWDFEPCGIAIRKSELRRLGAKPAIYGNDETWLNLPPSEQPYFQIASSNSDNSTVEWTDENEYRICGNVKLDTMPVSDVFLFVETFDEAETVSPLSRWPVVVLAE